MKLPNQNQDQESPLKLSDPIEILEKARLELLAESQEASRRPHDLREWAMPLHAASILSGAQYWLRYGPRLRTEFSNVAEFERAEKFFADREARGEVETCGHCHTTNMQKGLKWGHCDFCGVMGAFPTEAEAHKHEDANGMLPAEVLRHG